MSGKIQNKWVEAIISALIAFLTALGTASCTHAVVG